MIKNWLRNILFFILLVSFSLTSFAGNEVIVSKKHLKLIVVNEKREILCVMPCAVGQQDGPKVEEGDMRTPEGVFTIVAIENSIKWTHDFGDGYGKRKGAYGPWFIRLKTPNFTGIGIHGTCFPESIGKRSSEGCVRLRNEDVCKLVTYIKRGDRVIIY